ncbi:MAG: radical SAM protein [Myxococcota bacterium]
MTTESRPRPIEGLDPIAPDDGRRILYNPDSMAVIRGPAELMRRAEAMAEGRRASAEPSADDLAALQRVLPVITRPPSFTAAEGVAKVLTRLNVGNTYHCNMGCSYCYNELDSKDRKGSEVPRGMSAQVGRETIDAFVDQAGDEKQLSLCFIGGEPLLEKARLYEMVAYGRQRCAERGITLSVSVYTNGTGVTDELIDWINDNEIGVVVSLDGPPTINDAHRVFKNGRGTAKLVLRNIRRMMDRLAIPWRRVNAVAAEARAILPLARWFRDLGFNDIHIQTAYGEDGFGRRGDVPDVVELMHWYRERLLAGEVLAVAPFSNILGRLVERRANVTSWYPCTTGVSSLGVAPSGTLYPCHHFLEEDDFALGHVRDGLTSAQRRVPLAKRVDQREPCRSCWARHACGGECYHRAHSAGRGYDGVIEEACDGRKSLIGLTLELYADLARSHRQVLAALVRQHYTPLVPVEQAYAATDLSDYGLVPTRPATASPRHLPVLNLSR